MSNGYFPEHEGFGSQINGNIYSTTTDTLEYTNETGNTTTEIPIPPGLDIENKDALLLFKEDVSLGKTSIIPESDYMIDQINGKIILVEPIDVNDKVVGKILSSIKEENIETKILDDISNHAPENGEILRWDETIEKYVPTKSTIRSIAENINKVIDTSGGTVTEILMDPGIELSANAKPIIVVDGVPKANSIIQSIQTDRVILNPADAIPQDAVAEIMIIDTKDIPDQSVRDINDWADVAPTSGQLPLWDGFQYLPSDNALSINTDVDKVGNFEDGHILYVDSGGKFTNLPLSDLITEISESVQGAVLSVDNLKEGQTLVSRGNYFVNEYHDDIEQELYKNIELVTPPSEGTYIPIVDSVYIPPIKALSHQYTLNNYFTIESTNNQLSDNKYTLIFIDGMIQLNGFELPSQYKDTDLYKLSLVSNEIDFHFIENANTISVQGFFADNYAITPILIEHTTVTESNNITVTGTFNVTDVYITFVNNIHQTYSSVTPLIVGNDLKLTFDENIPSDIDIKVLQLQSMSTEIEIDVLTIVPAQTTFDLSSVPDINSHLIIFDGGYHLDPEYYYIQSSNNKLKINTELVSDKLTIYHFLNTNN